MRERETERLVWLVSILLLLAGVAVAAVVYWLTGVVLLVLVFAPPLVAYVLRRWRQKGIAGGNGYPFGVG